MNVYTIKDLASETFLRPFCMPTDRDAIEGFKHVCNEDDTQYSNHPQDFNLVSIGNFDERTGLLTVLTPHVTTARAVDLKEVH